MKYYSILKNKRTAMRKIIKMSCLLVALVCLSITVNAQKFGYVNSAALLSELPEVKQADANLEGLQKALQKKGQQMVANLQEDYKKIQQKAERGELSPQQQQEEGVRLEAKQKEISEFEQDMQKQIYDKRTKLLQPILDRVNTAIKDVSTEQGYTYIFDSSTGVLLYADETMDVSSAVKVKLGI